MKTPNGDLKIALLLILREYSCGCIVYRDESGQQFDERGLFCDSRGRGFIEKHKRALVQGEETQTALF